MFDSKSYFQMIEKSPIPTFWKDANLFFSGCNEAFLRMIGTENINELIGRKDLDLPWGENWQSYELDDVSVLRTGKSLSKLEEIPSPQGRVVISETQKNVIADGSINIGLVGFCREMASPALGLQQGPRNGPAAGSSDESTRAPSNPSLSDKLEALNLSLGLDTSKNLAPAPSLSQREGQIIYLLTLYKSPKEISSILSILYGKDVSVRSIQTAINNGLYQKFDVNNMGRLIAKAAAYDLIPSDLYI
ncbi:hypothetical protein [Chromobacterium sp. IIBBL 290-4]|uniref:hypothetical protein n=1 Tax=Chromobacterium sp. IIBBL 290-4 TaxID=2953890 RepID=UPI0020B84B3D|nr:hypothetical protein [Chromobacterium sp. IIBBL 290-4]UTH73562.1 hypothetical protein NKT35_18775 [Chromobacterium sp. IIBBL 290-4]